MHFLREVFLTWGSFHYKMLGNIYQLLVTIFNATQTDSQILPAYMPVLSPNMMQNRFLLIKDHIGFFAIAKNMYV